MAITAEKKKELIGSFKRSDKDTGSCAVQIALLSDRIQYMTEHMKLHPKDNHSRRGLVSMVQKRSRLLKYLMRRDFNQYRELIQRLAIRG